MFNIDTILVPTDFSEFADLALKRALDLAEACEAKIHLVHVALEAPDVFKLSKYIVEGQKKIRQELEEQSARCFEQQIAKFPAAKKVQIESTVLQGSPYKEVIDYQQQIKADMVVIETHGDTPLEGFFFGSTSAKIIRHATCTVMIVRKPKY